MQPRDASRLCWPLVTALTLATTLAAAQTPPTPAAVDVPASCSALQLHAEALRTARRFHAAAEAYAAIAAAQPGCGTGPEARIDEAYYSAALAYEAAAEPERAAAMREALVLRFLPRGSEYAQRALYREAAYLHAVQDVARAADRYEQYAAYVHDHRALATSVDPEAVASAAEALRRAMSFRVALGDEARALDDAARFAQYFGGDPARRHQTVDVALAAGHVYDTRAARLAEATDGTAAARARRRAETLAAWRDVARYYAAVMNRYAPGATLDQQILGNVALGRAYANLDDDAHAQPYLRAASQAWDPSLAGYASSSSEGAFSGEARIREQRSDTGDAGDVSAALVHARDAVAEARFLLAEATHRAYAARHLPAYHGPPSRPVYDAWATRELQPFVVAQRQTLEGTAVPQYQAVMAMHVPRWEIAAAARLAGMFRRFEQYLLEAVVPPDIARSPELLAVYNGILNEYAGTYRALATTGFEACLRLATSTRWFGEWSQQCARALTAVDPWRYPDGDELHAPPDFVFSRAGDALPVYESDGP